MKLSSFIRLALPVILIFTVTLGAFAAKKTSKSSMSSTPDFAYPKTVITNSESALKSALASGDDVKAIRAVLNFTLAQNSIGTENIPQSIKLITETRPKLKTVEARAFMDLLLAQVYQTVYGSNKYVYDNRTLPLTPLPADYTEWSGEQFRSVISALLDDAIAPSEQLRSIPISDYSSVVEIDRADMVYFPTLFDFVAHRSIELRSSLSYFSSCVGLISLSPRSVFIITPGHAPTAPEAKKILDTYALLLKYNSGNNAAEIYNDIARINFAASKIYSNLEDEANSTACSLLRDLYTQTFSTSAYSGDALIALSDRADVIDMDSYNEESAVINAETLYRYAKEFTARYPSFARINCIKNIIAQIEATEVTPIVPATAVPGREFKVKVRLKNVNSDALLVYRVDGMGLGSDNPSVSMLKQRTPIATVPFTASGKVPFRSTVEVPVTLPAYGHYTIVPKSMVTNKGFRNRRINPVYCTEIATGLITEASDQVAYVINPLTGKPIDKAEIRSMGRNNTVAATLGLTDADGFLPIPTDKTQRLMGVKGNDKYSHSIYAYSRYNEKADWSYSCNAFTDLPLYRPGDTVEWCAVLYSYKELERRLATDTEITAVLLNAIGTAVDTLKTTSDNWGRVNGKFTLPEGELTGQYRLFFKVGDKGAGTHWFNVSDYKLPTYFIELDKPASGVPAEGDVTITGRAVSYSGIGLEGIPVQAVISASTGHWWFRSNAVPFSTLRDTTTTGGRFTLVLKKDAIESSPAPEGLFTANVSATSLSGESREASTEFNVGLAYELMSKLPDVIEISHPVDLASYLNIMSSKGETVDSPIRFKLTSNTDSAISIEGLVTSDVDLSALKGSVYNFKFYAPDLKADTLVQSMVVLYHSNEKYSPVSKTLWSPKDNMTIDTGTSRDAELPVFACYDKTPALLVISNEKGTISSRRWIELKKGANSVKATIPDGFESATVTLLSTMELNTSNLTFRLASHKADQKLDIVIESFRDRMIPGSQETVTLRTVNKDSAGVQSAVVLDMFNSALSSLVKPDFSIHFTHSYIQPVGFDQPRFNYITISGQQPLNQANCTSIHLPDFLTYGLGFSPVSRMYFRKLNSMAYSAETEELVVANESKSAGIQYDMAAPAMAAKMELNDAIVVEEAAEEAADDSGAAQPESTKPAEQFQYRKSEVPLAFFAPTLTTDSNGNLSYTFTVPDANTTWTLAAMAYDKDFAASGVTRQAIANKPLMIQPNLPRFLRTGDVATISATVINNSDDAIEAAVEVELFNPADMSVITTAQLPAVSVAANAQSAVAYRLTAPADAPFIGFRIKATAGNYADGEQSVIPVLPASQPVIETTPFYVSPDSTDFSLRLPEYPSDAAVTLQFCDNPTWYVVTALPSISSTEARTAPQAASNIFSAAVADGLIHKYPQIASALKAWTSSDKSDSTLVSMLERNADLKTMLLKATPWMLDARSDTERMQRLALLFDTDNIRRAYDDNISLLGKLACSDGGFAWFGSYKESSQWATRQTLSILGRLNQLGFLPSDKKLTSLIKSALSYDQTLVEKQYRKYPKSDYTDFVILRDFWPEYKPSVTGQRIIAANVQKQISSWRKSSLIGKITAALILQRHGYAKVAAEVLSSIGQFAKSSPTTGMYWPLTDDYAGGSMTQLAITARALEAYALITPKAREIDAIRQWLILQKEARDWGNAAVASDVAATILLTSSTWIQPAGPAVVSIGGSEVKPSQVEETLGYFRTPITALSPSGAMLRIEKSDKTPAWGAVYSRSTKVMRDVKAVAIDGLSIEKQMFVQDGDKWKEATDLKVGDRVKVQLVIHAGRAIDYVAIDDERAACLEPVDQLPTPIFSEGLCFYRENGDNATRIFISTLPKGTYLLTYEMWVNNAGEFASGIATIQSQYAPQLTAHSAGSMLEVAPSN